MEFSATNILIIVSAIAIIAASGIALVIISRMVNKGQQQALQLELVNQGNAPSRYELMAEDPAGGLKFQFAAKGAALAVKQFARQGTPSPAQPPATGASSQPAAGGASGATGFASAVGDLLLSVGTLLPDSAGGSSLRSAGTRMKYGVYDVDRARNVAGDARALASGSQPQTSASTVAQSAAAPAAALDNWAQTPVVEPGGVLLIDMRIETVNPNAAGNFTFRVMSKSAEMAEGTQTTMDGAVSIKGASWLQRSWHWLAFLIITAIVIAGTAFLIMTRAIALG